MKSNIPISLDKTVEIRCEKCTNNVFQEAIMLRKASKFLTGTDQDALIPIPVFSCTSCGHVNSDFLPSGMKGDDEPKGVTLNPKIKL